MGRTQKVLADALASELEIHTRLARPVRQAPGGHAGGQPGRKGRVELRGFGIFALETRPARTIRHPRTGKPIKVGEKKAVRFRASAAIPRHLNPRKARPSKPTPAPTPPEAPPPAAPKS